MRIKRIIRIAHQEMILLADSGEQFTVDLRPLIQRGGVFVWLRLTICARLAKIRQKGLYLEWPWGLDIGADSLWERREMEPVRPIVRKLEATPVEQPHVMA